jgi:UDP-glucose 4-epimerase
VPGSSEQQPAHFRGRNILITGGLGFIGSTLARRLVEAGAKVTVVDSRVPEHGGNLFNVCGLESSLRLEIADVRDERAVARLAEEQDIVFNLAGQTSHLDSMQDPFTDLDINCRAQLIVLETLRKINPAAKVIFASTRQVYGRPSQLPVNERHLLAPVDVNGVHKMAGEWYHILYHRVYGMPTCALRLTNTYGPRMRVKDARQTFVGIWIRSLLEGKEFEVWGGEQLRDLCYVDDAVDAMLLCAGDNRADGRIYNLGGAEVVSLRQLADLLVAAHGSGTYRLCPYPADRKAIDIGDYYADFGLIRGELGWEPRVPLVEGIARTLAFYREHLDRYL